MPRTVYLIVFPAPLFPAHWALWIPSRSSPNYGKLIDAQGSMLAGFSVNINRIRPITFSGREYTIQELDNAVRDGIIIDDNDDLFEQIARATPPPGPSLVPAGGPRRNRITVSNCQDWMINYINALIAAELLNPRAAQVVQGAARN